MKTISHGGFIRGVLGLTVVTGLLALHAAADSIAPTNSAKSATAATPNTSLLNDWLREQTPAWKHLDLGGQVRVREQSRNRAGAFPNDDFARNSPSNSMSLLQLRETGHIGYTPTSWLAFFVEGRAAAESGDKRDPNPEANHFDLRQAFVLLGDLKEFPATLKVGRQELIYGDQRWVGNADWGNVGRSFDAVKLHAGDDLSSVDAFVSRPVYIYDTAADRANQYEYLSGLYASCKRLAPWQDTQLYFLSYNVGADSPSVAATATKGPTARDVYTLGTLMKSLPGALNGWDYSAELTMQVGSLTTNATQGGRLDLKAYGAFISGGYTCEQTWGKPRLGLGYDYGSGDDNAKDGKVGTLQNLFPTAHGLYGLMDLFSARNMHIPRLSGSLQPTKSLKLTADYLLFWVADTNDYLYPESGAARTKNGYGIHPDNNSFVGSELDLVANYNVRAWLGLQAGYGHFFVGDYVKESLAAVPATGGAVDADWAYVQATINF